MQTSTSRLADLIVCTSFSQRSTCRATDTCPTGRCVSNKIFSLKDCASSGRERCCSQHKSINRLPETTKNLHEPVHGIPYLVLCPLCKSANWNYWFFGASGSKTCWTVELQIHARRAAWSQEKWSPTAGKDGTNQSIGDLGTQQGKENQSRTIDMQKPVHTDCPIWLLSTLHRMQKSSTASNMRMFLWGRGCLVSRSSTNMNLNCVATRLDVETRRQASHALPRLIPHVSAHADLRASKHCTGIVLEQGHEYPWILSHTLQNRGLPAMHVLSVTKRQLFIPYPQ